MIDQCTIRYDREIRINPDVITSARSEINFRELPLEIKCSDTFKAASGGIERKQFAEIRILGDALVAKLAKPAECPSGAQRSFYAIKEIQINPAKILRGHNGQAIGSDLELAYALTIVRVAVASILENRNDAPYLIPGPELAENSCYWRKIEIALDLKDPDKQLLKMMKHARSSKIRDTPWVFGSTTQLDGTNLSLKAYDKVDQMKAKFRKRNMHSVDPQSQPGDGSTGSDTETPSGVDSITRFELCLKLSNMKCGVWEPFAFLPPEERPRMSESGMRLKLLSFNLRHLREAHRHYFSDLKGIFALPQVAEKKGNTDKLGAVMAAISALWKIPPGELLEVYKSHGRKSPSAVRSLRLNMERHLSLRNSVSAESVFSDKAYQCPVGVNVDGVGGFERIFGLLTADQDIRLAYSDFSANGENVKSTFIPHTMVGY